MKKLISTIVALSMICAPATAQATVRAAAYGPDYNGSYQKPTMFTGATLRLRADGHDKPKPEFAFRVTGGVRNGETNDLRLGEGLALKFSDNKPKLQIAGQDAHQVGPKLGLSTGEGIAIALGAIALVAVVGLMAWQNDVDEWNNQD